MCNQLIYSCECNLVVSKNFWAQFAPPCFISAKVLRTRLTRVLTLSDPGYFRQLTIRGGGALKAPPPYDLENYCVNLHHIIHVDFTRCFRYDPIGIFQKFPILTILQRFQNKK